MTVFNPFEPGYLADPYPQFARLRAAGPCVDLAPGTVALFRYQDVFAVLRNASTSVDERNAAVSLRTEAFERVFQGERRRRGRRAILNIDPPDHTRIRRLVSSAFTPRMIERLRPRVQRLVDERLAAAAGAGGLDVIDDLAFPLPFQVIAELLGMPESDSAAIRDWSGALVKTLDPVVSDDDLIAAAAASDLMTEHIGEVLAWKRRNAADDLLSALIDARDGDDRLDEEELRDQVVLLFVAGHETTVNLIGNGVLALLRAPDQAQRWRDEPGLDANAVDELLRYDAPVQFSRRIATGPLDLGGRVVEPGTVLVAGLAAANRDPAKWGPTADQLDLGREGAGQHLSFGSGTHYCLGASLARLEGQVAIGSLVRRFARLELATDTVSYSERINLRGLASLPALVG